MDNVHVKDSKNLTYLAKTICAACGTRSFTASATSSPLAASQGSSTARPCTRPRYRQMATLWLSGFPSMYNTGTRPYGVSVGNGWVRNSAVPHADFQRHGIILLLIILIITIIIIIIIVIMIKVTIHSKFYREVLWILIYIIIQLHPYHYK